MRIAVAGGTGTVGRLVVEAVRERGHEAVVLTRSSGVDLMGGEGLAAALDGADAVVDVTSTRSTSAAASARFFATVTRHLLAAERAAGVGHHVALSIIGAAGVDKGYYAGKKAQEDLVTAADVGWSLLRTTQFHEFVTQVMARTSIGPVAVVPTMRSQPVAAAEVGEALAEIALGAPRGLDRDLGGPREENVADMARRYLAATAQRRRVLQVPLPGAWGRAMRDGSLLPGPDARARPSDVRGVARRRGVPPAMIAEFGVCGAPAHRRHRIRRSPSCPCPGRRLVWRARGWWTGVVSPEGPLARHAFCVCLLATDQLSVDDRRCRPAF